MRVDLSAVGREDRCDGRDSYHQVVRLQDSLDLTVRGVVRFPHEPLGATHVLAQSTHAGRARGENVNQVLVSLMLTPIMRLRRFRPFARSPTIRKDLI
ncbi:hypothetical protein A5779_19535 [Mycolicibacterium peregrinum]|uniref:Uncharacterized protein n=1 Tax=Mycolicibacterium peregrinum TaxID=43304 RepID=A0A1A0WC36_MYCPR|nr:hypothetical protein A5779_19535 [Mycolicibacterium peregrinum]